MVNRAKLPKMVKLAAEEKEVKLEIEMKYFF